MGTASSQLSMQEHQNKILTYYAEVCATHCHVHILALQCAESRRVVRHYTLLHYHVQGGEVTPVTPVQERDWDQTRTRAQEQERIWEQEREQEQAHRRELEQ